MAKWLNGYILSFLLTINYYLLPITYYLLPITNDGLLYSVMRYA